MSDIFISYKREEQPLARKLADALQMKGWSVWWDPKLRTGEHFDDTIEKALNDAKCVIVMWSKLSVKSRYIKDEATYALNLNKLVPIAIEEVDLPFRFRSIQNGQLIDWDGSDSHPGLQKVIADITGILGESSIEMKRDKPEEAEAKLKTEEELKLKEPEEKPKREKVQDRSVSIGGSLIGSAIVTGDKNKVTVHFKKVEVPPSESVNIAAELEALKQILTDTQVSDKDLRKIINALEDAEIESKEAQPDRDEIGSALDRALKYAQRAEGFAERIVKLKPHIQSIAGWLGESWYKLLAIVGLKV